MSDQRRLRSNATSFTTDQKMKLAKDAGITEDMDKDVAEEKMKIALDNMMKKEIENHTYYVKRPSKICHTDDFQKDLPTPKYQDIKKEYVSKGEKVYLNKIDYIIS